MANSYKFRYHPTTNKSQSLDPNDLVEHKIMCGNCGLISRFEIILDPRHTYMECICPVCRKHKLISTFNFCVHYMRKHFPDHELLKEVQNSIRNEEPVNTVPLTKFVYNFVEFNKTLE